MHERRRFDTLLALVERLVEANEATPILVEGQRDVAALRAVGCTGTVLTLKGPAPLADVAHAFSASHRHAILLPDWDRAGLALRDAAHAQLAAHGVRCDVSYHARLVGETDLALKDVETLAAVVARGLRRFHGRRLDDHVRGLRGDPLGVEGLREEFADVPPRAARSAGKGNGARRPRHKRRARPEGA